MELLTLFTLGLTSSGGEITTETICKNTTAPEELTIMKTLTTIMVLSETTTLTKKQYPTLGI